MSGCAARQRVAPIQSYRLEVLPGTWEPELRLVGLRPGMPPEGVPDQALVLRVAPGLNLTAVTGADGVAQFELSDDLEGVDHARLRNVIVGAPELELYVSIDVTSYGGFREIEREAAKRRAWEARRQQRARSAAPAGAATDAGEQEAASPESDEQPPARATEVPDEPAATPAEPARPSTLLDLGSDQAVVSVSRPTAVATRVVQPTGTTRPAGFSLGIGVGYSIGGQAPATGGRPDRVSVRLRWDNGFELEPSFTLATAQVKLDHGSAVDEQVINRASLGAWARIPIRATRKVEFMVLGGIELDRVAYRYDVADTDVVDSGFTLAWGLSIDYWLSGRWQLSLAAVNPLVATSQENQEAADDTSGVAVGAYFDPTALAMVHLYY